MRRNLTVLAGIGAAAVGIVYVTQTGMIREPERAPAAQDADAAPAPDQPAEQPAAATRAAALEAEVARLSAALADREAALADREAAAAVIEAALADRDAKLAGRDAALADREAAMTERDAELAERETASAARDAANARSSAALAERDAASDALTAALKARDAEILALRAELAALRGELVALRNRFAFDIQLAAMKLGDGPASAPVEAARADAADLEDMLALAKPTTAARAAEQPMTAIHFDTGSASLTPGGQVHAAAAAVMLADMPLERVRVVGYADRTGSPDRNRRLAERRARAVADFLMSAGLPADRLETSGMIEAADLPVATGAGVPEPLNRSVAIIAVPLPTT